MYFDFLPSVFNPAIHWVLQISNYKFIHTHEPCHLLFSCLKITRYSSNWVDLRPEVIMPKPRTWCMLLEVRSLLIGWDLGGKSPQWPHHHLLSWPPMGFTQNQGRNWNLYLGSATRPMRRVVWAFGRHHASVQSSEIQTLTTRSSPHQQPSQPRHRNPWTPTNVADNNYMLCPRKKL